jgi:hypothetical protein
MAVSIVSFSNDGKYLSTLSLDERNVFIHQLSSGILGILQSSKASKAIQLISLDQKIVLDPNALEFKWQSERTVMLINHETAVQTFHI